VTGFRKIPVGQTTGSGRKRPAAGDRFPQEGAGSEHRSTEFDCSTRCARSARIAPGKPPTLSSLADENACRLTPPQHGGARSGATPRKHADAGRIRPSRPRIWERSTRGVYAASLIRTQFEELAAWQLVLPRTAAFSHLTAARLRG
jgi:hypothetical protein